MNYLEKIKSLSLENNKKKILSSDMFSEVFEADPFSKESGLKYRKQVLAPGGVGKISDHLEKFLGREPSQAAFLKARGIGVE